MYTGCVCYCVYTQESLNNQPSWLQSPDRRRPGLGYMSGDRRVPCTPAPDLNARCSSWMSGDQRACTPAPDPRCHVHSMPDLNAMCSGWMSWRLKRRRARRQVNTTQTRRTRRPLPSAPRLPRSFPPCPLPLASHLISQLCPTLVSPYVASVPHPGLTLDVGLLFNPVRFHPTHVGRASTRIRDKKMSLRVIARARRSRNHPQLPPKALAKVGNLQGAECPPCVCQSWNGMQTVNTLFWGHPPFRSVFTRRRLCQGRCRSIRG